MWHSLCLLPPPCLGRGQKQGGAGAGVVWRRSGPSVIADKWIKSCVSRPARRSSREAQRESGGCGIGTRIGRHFTSLHFPNFSLTELPDSYLIMHLSLKKCRSCPTEEKIGLEASDRGQDGEKWVCDTDLLVRGGCLVYSFGSHSNFMFEKGMSSRFQCEIHTFDPFLVKKVPELEGVDVRLHAWGLAEETRQQPMPSRRGMPKKGVPDMLFLKSLPDIIEALGHTGRKIDVLKLDVEGFEFGVLDNHTMWRDVARLGTSVSQVLVEVHSKGINRQTFSWRNASVYEGRDMDNLFRVMSDQGYGIFHKEINTFPTANLLCAEFGFVKLGIKCSKSKRPQSDAEKFSSSVLNPGSEEVKRKRAILTDVSEFVY